MTETSVLIEEMKEHVNGVPEKALLSKKVAKPLWMNIDNSSSVKPLLERLISKGDLGWKETLGKDFRLKWVSCNFDD